MSNSPVVGSNDYLEDAYYKASAVGRNIFKPNFYKTLDPVNPIIDGIPKQEYVRNIAHTDLITSLNWCTQRHSNLYLSSSFDETVKVWELDNGNPIQCIDVQSPVNFAKWSLDSGHIIIGGADKKAHIYDSQTGTKIHSYSIFSIAKSAAIHPNLEDVFVCCSRKAVLGFDLRVHDLLPIRTFFFPDHTEMQDVAFIDENQLICCANSNAADTNLMVMHFGNGQKLSNEILSQALRCTSAKVHPTDPWFAVQCGGFYGYIATFGTDQPYEQKDKQFCGHEVGPEIPIEFDFSPDGRYIVSGDDNGNVVYYNCASTKPVFVGCYKGKNPINRVNWHPYQPSTVLASTKTGEIFIFKD